MIEEEEMSGFEKSKLPYVLLLDREGGRAAAYLNNHQLLVPLTSMKLIAFAEANPSLERAWSEEAHHAGGFEGRVLPDWATPEVRQRCVLVWIKRGNASDEYFASIPKK
ncbi:MAG: hypothetical protein Q7U28_08100 [Aquabacterium sp.]|nr:hypothetical protein [Aquabacterium sp.]